MVVHVTELNRQWQTLLCTQSHTELIKQTRGIVQHLDVFQHTASTRKGTIAVPSCIRTKHYVQTVPMI